MIPRYVQICSITALHLSSSFSTYSTVSLTSTKLSANNNTQVGLVPASSTNTSMMTMRRFRVSADSWCNPSLKDSVLPHSVFSPVVVPLYMSSITLTYYICHSHRLHHYRNRFLCFNSIMFNLILIIMVYHSSQWYHDMD